jgi:hypothetical protein
MLHLLFFLVIDAVFFSTLVGMSACMDKSELVYVSEWIRQCKQSDVAAHQSLPVFVTISFVLMVQCQIEWMLGVAYNADHSGLHTCPDCAGAPKGYHVLDDTDVVGFAARAHPPTSEFLLTMATTFKLACVLGVLFVFIYDYRYTTTKSALVYTHYYGVLLVTIGLAGVTNLIWWKLEQARNKHFLANHVAEQRRTAAQALQKLVFRTGDVCLIVAIVWFFASTALTNSKDEDKFWHNSSVISEFIAFILLAIQFMWLFWRCRALIDSPPIQRVSNYFRFAVIFLVLILPLIAMQFIVVPRAPCPAETIIYDATHCAWCNTGEVVVNSTHCCMGGRFTGNATLPEWTKDYLGDHKGGMCYTCSGGDNSYCYHTLDYSHP